MSFATLAPNWQVTVLFFLTLLPLCGVMKLVAFWGTPQWTDWALVLSPFPSPRAVERALPFSAGPRLIGRCLVASSVCVGLYWIHFNFILPLRLSSILLGYYGAIVLWVVSEALGSLVPFLAFSSGRLLPLPHGSAPPLARSLADFWGRRWNTWTSDFFRVIIFEPLQRRPRFALFAAFFVSGLLHEWVINVPLYLVTGRKLFGSMMLYFLLQPVGILLERRTRHPAFRRLAFWLFVFGAAPLIVNEGLLRILHLWP